MALCRGVAWIFEVVRRILLFVTELRPVHDAAGVAWGGLEGGGVAPPAEDFL